MSGAGILSSPSALGLADPRRHLVAVVVLAVAILACAGTSVGVLVGGDTAAPVAAPADPAPGPAPVATPADAPLPAPVVADAAGRPVPAAVATGVRSVDDALAAGDLPALQRLYDPARSTGSARWPVVATALASPQVRDGLRSALRVAPERGRNVAWVYTSRDGHRLGLDARGRLGFIQAP